MTSNRLRGCSGLAALALCAMFVTEAGAFCSSCGGGTTAFYQPAPYTAAYAPAAYTTNYGATSGWYPGYWLNRVSQNIWGSPTTYAVAYPTTYAASYQPAVSVGYAGGYAAPACSTCTAGYAPCSSCAPVQTVTMRPVCTTACAPVCATACPSCPGSGCASCGTGVVSQAVYQESSGCTSCGQAEAVSSTTVVVPGGQPMEVPQHAAPANGGPSPTLAPSEQVSPERTFQKPPTNGADQSGSQDPGPAGETPPTEPPANNESTDPLDGVLNGNESESTYFEAPKLFNPKDRTATRVTAPVWKAVYERPISHRQVSLGPITADQAQRDAAGWTSASN